MKLRKLLVASLVILSGVLGSTAALARGHGGRVHFGLYFGAPGYWYYPSPYYYYPPYYYPPTYPPVVVMPSSPPTYVERGDTAPPPERSESYWYYCPDTNTYYPYVKDCASPWQRVVPQPPNS